MTLQQTIKETSNKDSALQIQTKTQKALEAPQGHLLVQHDLHLAALQALKGKAGLKRGLIYLGEAFQTDPNIIDDPLYQALYWEFSAYGGKASTEVAQGALEVAKIQNNLSRYHAARALFATGSLEATLIVLKSISVIDLLQHQKSHHYFLLGQTYQSLGQFSSATKVFDQAIEFSQALECQQMLLNLASSWLEVSQIQKAADTLVKVEFESLNEPQQLYFHLIKGQVALRQGDFATAFNKFLAAQSLENYSENALEIYLSLAQSCIMIGKGSKAFGYFENALKVASKENKSFIKHEYAFALMSEKHYLEAKSLLEGILLDDAYNMRFQVLADLAEANYYLGLLTEAEHYAKAAIEEGEGLRPCLLLGQISLNYYQYDEALTYFEKALSETKPNDKNWVLSHTMIANTLAKQGFKDPQRISLHAEAALTHMPQYENWRIVLEDYLKQAKKILGGYTRILN